MSGIVRHRGRSWGAGAAVAAIVFAVVGSGRLWTSIHQPPASAQRRAATRSGMVPWTDTTGTPAVVSEPVPSAPPAPAWPPCASTALRASDGAISDWAGTVGMSVAVTNISARGCVLAGGPTSVEAVRADGTTVRVKAGPVDPASVQLHTPAGLAPGQHAEFVLEANDVCPTPVTRDEAAFTAFRFRVAAGPWMTVTVPEHETIALPCARWFSGFGTAAPVHDDTHPAR